MANNGRVVGNLQNVTSDFPIVSSNPSRNAPSVSTSKQSIAVIGRVGLAELTPALRKAETRLGREVNATSYSAREFRNRVAAKDHFLSEVLKGPKQFVKGDQRDLDEIVGKPRRSAASDVEKRARRHAGARRA